MKEFTKESLQQAIELMKNLPHPEDRLPSCLACGKEYHEKVVEKMPVMQPVTNILMMLGGIKIFIDETLPPNVAQARNHKGEVLETFLLGEAK